MMIKHISVVMIVKNGAKTIEQSLKSLKDFENVVVYDNGSTDNTMEIVKQFSNVELVQGSFLGFGETKQKASTFAKNNWILNIDCDELLDSELIEELKSKKLENDTVYSLNRHNYYKDYHIKHCGWNNEKIKRLYNRTITNFNNNKVHEFIVDDNLKSKVLKGNLKHYTYHSIEEFIDKLNLYASLYTKNNKGKKSSSPLKAVLNAIFTFNKIYFLKRGFLDGYVGLLISFSHMCTNFYKYLMLYEANKELEQQNTIS